MRLVQANGGEEIGCAQVIQVDLGAPNGIGTRLQATTFDIEVFHQSHPGEETLDGRQAEGFGDLAEGFEQGVLAFQVVGSFGRADFDRHFQQCIEG